MADADVVILCKPLASAKQRLAGMMDAATRRALAAAMLRDVIASSAGARHVRRVAVRSHDPEVGRIAALHGIDWDREDRTSGLNAAAGDALALAGRQGCPVLLLLHADLPYVRSHDIEALLAFGPSAAVRAEDGGTTALLLDPARPFAFHFGPRSFATHAMTERRQGRTLRRFINRRLGDDVDCAAAVHRLAQGAPGPYTRLALPGRLSLRDQAA